MSNSFPEPKRRIIESLRTMILERMPEDQAEQVVRFVVRYYARAENMVCPLLFF